MRVGDKRRRKKLAERERETGEKGRDEGGEGGEEREGRRGMDCVKGTLRCYCMFLLTSLAKAITLSPSTMALLVRLWDASISLAC
jgi:hypothetical protein